jgi:serine/threonine protein kinase
MTASSVNGDRQTPLTAEAAEALAAELVTEMIDRWRQGERLLPEDFLARHPGLWAHPQAAADLIYEELCLRQEYGPDVPLELVLRRFPQWRPQLEVLFDCQRVLSPRRTAPEFPEAGETLGDFLLLAELGRGAQGRVFLASQRSLGDRPVVLKVSPAEAGEHLSLARLQHTHIVPLYSVQDQPDRGLRALCMPYFGGATLAQIFEGLQSQPPSRRTGRHLLEALDRAAAGLPNPTGSAPGPARQLLARASYVEAVCWTGACLADALQYAHERSLVHLDLKPSNILLAADGQPMLLDFHLARGPVRPDNDGPPWLGGTPGYMAPEQQAALLALQHGRPLARGVDARADIYSLGVALYEALAGSLPPGGGNPPPLHRRNGQVSVGLADLVHKCLAGDPEARYPDMAALAADLRRHLAHQPLAGVRNRSLGERWRKWRRRRPHGIARAGMLLAVLTAAGAVGLGAASSLIQRSGRARTALTDGRRQMANRLWDEAVSTLRRGLSVARELPFQGDLAARLEGELRQAETQWTVAKRAAAVREFHELADRLRFLYGTEPVPPDGLRGLEASCRTVWANRGRIAERLDAGAGELEPMVRDDLLDLAILWADLQVRLAPPAGKAEARRGALAVLAEAEALFGASPVLDAERRLHGAPRAPGVGSEARGAGTAWEHYALGRALLRSGEPGRAAREIGRAVRVEPQGLWPNFYQGLCAYRLGRYEDAATAFSVCIGAAPEAAACFYNRGLALAALGRPDQALDDFDQAVRLDPTLAVAAQNRASLLRRAQDGVQPPSPAGTKEP